jgi:hypothetical protein
MNDLLDFVLDAHGGLKRCSGVSTLTAKLAAGGPFWGQQGFPDAFLDETLTIASRTSPRSSYAGRDLFGPALILMPGIAAGVSLGRIALTVWTLRHPVYCRRGCRRPQAKGPARFMDAGAAQAAHGYFTGPTDRLRYRGLAHNGTATGDRGHAIRLAGLSVSSQALPLVRRSTGRMPGDRLASALTSLNECPPGARRGDDHRLAVPTRGSTAPGPGAARTSLAPIGSPHAEQTMTASATSPQPLCVICWGGPSGATWRSPH